MMKNYKIYLFIIVLTLGFSCEDFVDIEPLEQNTENYFNSPEDYQNTLIGVYDLLSTTYFSNIVGEIASDNTLCGGENATDVLDWQQIDDMNHTADNAQLREYWRWMYGGITRANYLMEFKDKIDFQGKDHIIAETRFLRSYYYFELTKFFGGVPLIIDRRVSQDEASSIPRASKEDVYAQIIADLELAIPDLEWQPAQKGRVTKGAALALLGKVHLFNEDFASAKDALDQVINSGQYELVSNFSHNFLLETENNSESIFEVQYNGQEGGGFDCFSCVEGNIAVGFMGPRFSGGDYNPYADGFSFNVPTQDLYDLYESDDTRRDATIFVMDDFISTHPDVTYTEGYENTGLFNKKYIPYNEGNLPDPHLTHSNNYRSIRLADVLLMSAEAYNRGGFGDAMAQNYLNQVRQRAIPGAQAVTSTGSQLTQDIWDERRLELAGEGHRFFDQVRTGQTSSIPGFTPGKNELFPIPLLELQLVNNAWPQNPGY